MMAADHRNMMATKMRIVLRTIELSHKGDKGFFPQQKNATEHFTHKTPLAFFCEWEWKPTGFTNIASQED